MITKIVRSGISFYSVKDVNKILKESSAVMIAEKAIKGNGLKNNDDYFKKDDHPDYYFTKESIDKMLNPFKKTLNGMLAIRAMKELTEEAEPAPVTPEVKPEKDYSKRLVNANSYNITYHASLRIKERFGIAQAKQSTWFASMAPRLGYIGTQFGNTQEVWGNDEVTVITSPTEKSVITVLNPDMDVNVSHSSYKDIDEQFEQAIHSMLLGENRSYWEELSACFTQLGEFAQAAAQAIDGTRNTRSPRGLEIMAETEKNAIDQYKKLAYDIDSTICEHAERIKYIESKR